MNRIILSGRPTKDPEVKYSQGENAMAIARFTLAVDRKKSSSSETDFISCVAFGKTAEFIEKLPDGYQTKVERGGLNFSGGQRQRLTIARALVKNPDILILDDSSSALDFATDAALRRGLRDCARDMTVFMVSQRASSLQQADRILVLNDGELVGCGTHEQLFASCEPYREICLSQLSAEEAKA